ncbi:hypothetical protein BDA99DRAFT_435268, partial [Phascolomyces articulosus]
LTDQYWRRCSEQSIIVKFWANIFETFFHPYKKRLFRLFRNLPMVDMNGWTMRLDLRFLVSTLESHDFDGSEQVEAAAGKFASSFNTSVTKLYEDKLKPVLVSKVHLNSVLQATKFIPPSTIGNTILPIVQIMGPSYYIYGLSVVDKEVYCLQKVCSFVYP